MYNKLSDKAKELYLDLWEPRLGQIVILPEGGIVIFENIDNPDTGFIVQDYNPNYYVCDSKVHAGFNKKDLIPIPDEILCINMLEKMGYVAQSCCFSNYDKKNYETELVMLGKLKMECFSGYATRLESLEKALIWALEDRVKER